MGNLLSSLSTKNGLNLSNKHNLANYFHHLWSSSSSPIHTNNNLNLNNLPDEIYHFYIFQCLDLDEILELRLVSKKFYCLVHSFNINQLSFIDYDLYNRNYKKNWFSTTKSCRFMNHFDISKIGLLNNPADYLLNLKCLRLDRQRRFELDILNDQSDRAAGVSKILDEERRLYFQLKCLNKFTKLQILDVNIVFDYSSYLRTTFHMPNLSLHLPNLRSLSIQIDKKLSNKFASFVIDTPKLQILYVNPYIASKIGDKFKFKHPNSVRKLQLDDYKANVSIFKNLESLELAHFTIPNLDDILKFKNLKTFKFNSYHYSKDAIKKLKDLFKMKKNRQEIVFKGVKIREISKFDEFSDRDGLLKFQIDNYDDLDDDIHFFHGGTYDQIISILPSNLPSDLFKKYNNVQSLKITKRIDKNDQMQLVNFIRECHNLFSLEICNDLLSQEFYDQLPAVSTLSSLDLYEMNINFKFIQRMSYLVKLYIDKDVLTNEDFNLNDLKHLKRYLSKINNQSIHVRLNK